MTNVRFTLNIHVFGFLRLSQPFHGIFNFKKILLNDLKHIYILQLEKYGLD